MTPEERKLVATVLDQHNEVLRAFRASSDAFDHAMTAMRDTFAAIRAASEAQSDAITRVIAANEAALALFNREEEGR